MGLLILIRRWAVKPRGVWILLDAGIGRHSGPMRRAASQSARGLGELCRMPTIGLNDRAHCRDRMTDEVSLGQAGKRNSQQRASRE